MRYKNIPFHISRLHHITTIYGIRNNHENSNIIYWNYSRLFVRTLVTNQGEDTEVSTIVFSLNAALDMMKGLEVPVEIVFKYQNIREAVSVKQL